MNIINSDKDLRNKFWGNHINLVLKHPVTISLLSTILALRIFNGYQLLKILYLHFEELSKIVFL